jgi:serine/threonine protein kinase
MRHRNILKLIEVLYSASLNEVYLVLEYAERGSLANLMNPLPWPAIFSIIKQIAQGLKYLHDQGYVHQDIKPSNILIDHQGRALIADFGIGHSFGSASLVLGSPAYQAPEALEDGYCESDHLEPQKEDVWSLGVTLYQLLFQQLPFVGNNLFEIMNAIKSYALKIPEPVDPLVVNLLSGLLCSDPDKRFGIEEILEHPLIYNADDMATGLSNTPVVVDHEGEVQAFMAEIYPENGSFAELAFTIMRRSSLQECGFKSKARVAVQEEESTDSSDSEPPQSGQSRSPWHLEVAILFRWRQRENGINLKIATNPIIKGNFRIFFRIGST